MRYCIHGVSENVDCAKCDAEDVELMSEYRPSAEAIMAARRIGGCVGISDLAESRRTTFEDAHILAREILRLAGGGTKP